MIINIKKDILHPILQMDWLMNVAIVLLLITGIMFVYSSCYIDSELAVRPLYKKQILWAFIGSLGYFFFSVVDYRRLRKFSWMIYAAALVLLVTVIFIGKEMYGAKRWLMLFGENGIVIQPSEIAKISILILLGRKLSMPGENFVSWKPVLMILALVGLPIMLIMQQPDLGTSLVLLPMTLMMMFVANVPWKTIGTLALIGITCISIVLGAVLLPEKLGADKVVQAKVLRLVGLKPYHKKRIDVFFNAEQDPLGAGWNKRQSEIAVGSGGLWGKGYLKGTQNILGFLPRSVAPNDFIFSVIAEEMGFIGSTIILLLYTTLIGCAIRTAFVAIDKFGRLLCIGVVAMLFTHVFINIAMTIGFMPITGLPLPLLSYGGSFMVVMMATLGIVQSVFIRSHHSPIIYKQGRLWETTPGS